MATDVFPITGAWASPLPLENHLIFLSHQAAPPAPWCHKGATSQDTKELVPGWSPCSTCQTACVSPPCLQHSSVAGEPTSMWVSSLLPKDTPAAPGKDSQHPADLARESPKAVSNTSGSSAPAKMQHCFCKGNRNGLAHRIMSFVTSCVIHTRVCRKAHEHWCYLPTPLREGTGEGSTGFLVKGKCPWGKCLA